MTRLAFILFAVAVAYVSGGFAMAIATAVNEAVRSVRP